MNEGTDDDPSHHPPPRRAPRRGPSGCAIVFAVALWATAIAAIFISWPLALFIMLGACIVTAGITDPG